ncbi:MAG: hypothetical protein EOM52_02285 [Clostridia bacterium]|nr:hypothetical protein [Clostridia bacterium]
MKINSIKALDYKAQGDRLTLTLAETTMEAITDMDAALVSVQTDAGDAVETFAGYTLQSVTYDVAATTYTATLTRGAPDTTAAALDAITAQITAQETVQEDIMVALAELADLVAAGAGAGEGV